MKFLKGISVALVLFLVSCGSSDDNREIIINSTSSLSQDIEGRTIEQGAVIACAAGSMEDPNLVKVYFFPEPNATNFRLYETNAVDVDPNDFSNYRFLNQTDVPFFNGFLREYARPFDEEQWLIVTFELDGEIKISNPIRTKNVTQPTVYSNDITINQDTHLMPVFTWEAENADNTAIFFQVMSTLDGGALSGTYTIEERFQYYNIDNVVLNISVENPLNLTPGLDYRFTLMDVSQDNWVNEFLTLEFIAE